MRLLPDAVMEHEVRDEIPFEINPMLDARDFAETFCARRRVRIGGFLKAAVAIEIYHDLKERLEWNTLFVSKGRVYAAPAKARREYSDEADDRVCELAYKGAEECDVSFFYDANAVVAPVLEVCASNAPHFERFAKLLRQPAVIDFIRRTTRLNEISRVDVQAQRFRCGHFVSMHAGTRSSDKEGTRCASYCYHLTPEWKVEWGGLHGFRGRHGVPVEAFPPCFNTLDIFAFPLAHWTSIVAPFADGAIYTICGGLYGSKQSEPAHSAHSTG